MPPLRPRSAAASAAVIAAALLLLPGSAAFAADFNDARPNASGQRPAFPGQTRAPVIADTTRLQQTVVASGLDHPWGMAELPDGGWLVTERPGTLRLVRADGSLSAPILGLPAVAASGQGGLLDVAVRDDFATTRRVWWSYAEPRGADGTATAVATGTLSADATRLTDVRVIFRQTPAWRSSLHFGSRLVFDRDGGLFITTGERSDRAARPLAQDPATHLGKVVRIHPDGGLMQADAAFPGGLPEVWSIGHRNVQGATLAPDGTLWTVEHGPRGGDELNRPQQGKNYGWPVITYGQEYSGSAVGTGTTAQAGMEQPVYYWDPVIAPGGIAFYTADRIPGWRDSLLIAGLGAQALVRLTLDPVTRLVTGEARYFDGTARIRDVAVARDGAVMLLTDDSDGALIRVDAAR